MGLLILDHCAFLKQNQTIFSRGFETNCNVQSQIGIGQFIKLNVRYWILPKFWNQTSNCKHCTFLFSILSFYKYVCCVILQNQTYSYFIMPKCDNWFVVDLLVLYKLWTWNCSVSSAIKNNFMFSTCTKHISKPAYFGFIEKTMGIICFTSNI